LYFNKRGRKIAALRDRGTRGLEQLHRIAGWVFEQNLSAARSSDDIVAKFDSSFLEDVRISLKVATLHNYPIPPPWLRSSAVRHRLRATTWAFRWAQHELQILAREDGEVWTRLGADSKPQMMGVKRNRCVDVVHDVANHERIQLHK